jgi:DNA-binding winged helix-turn-helix (wHTH) protein
MRLKFDDHILDVVRRELWHGSARVAVEPQVFDLLAYLVQNPDRVVSRDELLQAIWDGRAISDSAIANRINGARRAIGDSGEMQRAILTVPRKGFRFIGLVEVLPARSVVRLPMSNFFRRAWQPAGFALLGAAIAVILARPETFPGTQSAFLPQPTAALPIVLVSALPPRPFNTGANDPDLAAITLDDHVLDRAAPPQSVVRAVPTIAKPSRDVAAAALPASPIVPVTTQQGTRARLAEAALPRPALAEPVGLSSPSSGKTWVDEANWSVIPCADARIDLGDGARCQVGPPVSWGGHYCDISQQVATVTNARYQIEAEVRIFDPYKVTATGPQGKGCTVWADRPDKPDYFKDMNQVTKRGNGWANLVTGGTLSTATFINSGRSCLAIKRLGPPWHGGYVWVMNASICPIAAAGSVRVADIDDALGTLQVRTYDAQANLRVQSQ